MNFEISDLAGLSKPLERLIDVVASGIGVMYEPRRIKQLALARADATAIQALAEAAAASIKMAGMAESSIVAAEGNEELKSFQIRSHQRLRKLETRCQMNIDAVVAKAALDLSSTVPTEWPSEDWVADFFDQCKDIGDEGMQTIWGRILSGEVARPGSFSPRTLAAVKLMRRFDAELFTRFCTFGWFGESRHGYGCVVIMPEEIGKQIPHLYLHQMELLHLAALGLIQFNPIASFNLRSTAEGLVLAYGSVSHTIMFPKQGSTDIGGSLVTDVGSELSRIAGATPNEPYRQAVVRWFRSKGHTVEEARIEAKQE